ncbi:hypothetical protein ACVR0S_00785 [Streptococcus dentapri]|uniref:Membrane protein 6-pyruvoyl-tetrahydropterin synthase-related domain-containing protein n=1 Tax=Streptococcus dentapri TaxID=573564 RepID=A0ABV8CZW7_9STRE
MNSQLAIPGKMMTLIKDGYYSAKSRFLSLPHYFQVAIISFLVSLLYLLPVLFGSRGGLYGDDLHFHIDRVRGLAGIWHSPVNFRSFYKVGQGINFFYPYLTYYPYYLLYSLFHDFYKAWMIYFYILTSLTYFIAYFSSLKILHSRWSSHLFALLYTFAAYRLDNFIIRFAVGELIAITFLPLVFSGLYLILRGNYGKWYYLSFGITLILYSHILSFVMAVVLVIFIYLTTIWFSKERLVRSGYLAVAGLAGFAMGSFQLFPMLEQLNYHRLIIPGKFTDDLEVKKLSDLISTAFLNDLQQHTFGLFVLISFLLVIGFLIRSFFIKKIKAIDYYLFGLTLILIILETPFFDLSALSTIQFVWRLNAYISLFVFFLLAKFIGHSSFKYLGRGSIYLILLVTLMLVHSTTCYNYFNDVHKNPVNHSSELSKRNSPNKLANSIMLTDYANHSQGKKREIYDADNKIHHRVFEHNSTSNQLESWASFENSSAIFTVINPSWDSQIVDLPVYHYKGQIAWIDGQPVSSLLSKSSGSTMVYLPPGEHQVEISYDYTPLAKIAFLFSVLTLLNIIVHIVYINNSLRHFSSWLPALKRMKRKTPYKMSI